MTKNITTYFTVHIAPNMILHYSLIHLNAIHHNAIQLMQYSVPNTPLMYCHLNLKPIKKIQNRGKKKKMYHKH